MFLLLPSGCHIRYFCEGESVTDQHALKFPVEYLTFLFFFIGEAFELFVPVSDLAFIIFMAAIAALLLVALALLGHLLGFHIYLSKRKEYCYSYCLVNSLEPAELYAKINHSMNL